MTYPEVKSTLSCMITFTMFQLAACGKPLRSNTDIPSSNPNSFTIGQPPVTGVSGVTTQIICGGAGPVDGTSNCQTSRVSDIALEIAKCLDTANTACAVFTSIRSDFEGKFQVNLEFGHYLIGGMGFLDGSAGSGAYPRVGSASFLVETGRLTPIEVDVKFGSMPPQTAP